jgi:hypothetical protein
MITNSYHYILNLLYILSSTKTIRIVQDYQFTRKIWKVCELGIRSLDRSGAPDIYKRFRIMDGSFMFYMYDQYGKYNYSGCHRMVTKKRVDENGHVWSFLSHEKLSVHVHNRGNNGGSLSFVQPTDKLILLIHYMIRDRGTSQCSTILLSSFTTTRNKKKFQKTNGLGTCIRLLWINS